MTLNFSLRSQSSVSSCVLLLVAIVARLSVLKSAFRGLRITIRICCFLDVLWVVRFGRRACVYWLFVIFVAASVLLERRLRNWDHHKDLLFSWGSVGRAVWSERLCAIVIGCFLSLFLHLSKDF